MGNPMGYIVAMMRGAEYGSSSDIVTGTILMAGIATLVYIGCLFQGLRKA